jgi:hypothetical protein
MGSYGKELFMTEALFLTTQEGLELRASLDYSGPLMDMTAQEPTDPKLGRLGNEGLRTH